MQVVTKYEVACRVRCLGPWQRRELYRRRRSIAGTVPQWRYILSPDGNYEIESPTFVDVMKVVGKCTRRGGEVTLVERKATEAERKRGWITVANITLIWPEKGRRRGKRKVSASKPARKKLSQGFAGELDHPRVSGPRLCDDAQADLLPDGRPSAD